MAFKKIERLTMADIEPRMQRSGGCWNWLRLFQSSGYGRIKISGRTFVAHRAVYEALVGPVAQTLQLDHLCRNRRCVNPDHLEPVTPQVNQLRSPLSPSAINARKTHCAKGHVLSGSNVRIRSNGSRRCQTCEYARQKRLRSTPAARASHAVYERKRRLAMKGLAQ